MFPLSSAHAACSDPVGAEGDMVYNTSYNVMMFCDDTDWISMSGGGGGGGGGGGADNLGDHTATQTLVMSSQDITGANNITYSGTLTDTSDARLKMDIEPLRDYGSVLDKVNAIKTYSYRMKGDPDSPREFGVMAQDLEAVFPELVKTGTDPMRTKSVNYVGLIAPLIEAVKLQQTEIEALRSEIESLKADAGR